MDTGINTCKWCHKVVAYGLVGCPFCGANLHYQTIAFTEKPPWVDKAKSMPDPSKMDAKAEQKATDLLESEKKKELRYSAKNRQWEVDRKKEWQGNKKAWMKDQAYKKNKEMDKTATELAAKIPKI